MIKMNVSILSHMYNQYLMVLCFLHSIYQFPIILIN